MIVNLPKANVISTTRKVTSSVTPILGSQQSSNDGQWCPLTLMKTMMGVTAAGALVSGGILDGENKTDCCGIVGVVGTQDHDAR